VTLGKAPLAVLRLAVDALEAGARSSDRPAMPISLSKRPMVPIVSVKNTPTSAASTLAVRR